MPTTLKITSYQFVLTLTSNWISRLFWSGHAEGGIQKMRSIFFGRSKSSPNLRSGFQLRPNRRSGWRRMHTNYKLPAKTKTLLTIKI